jgi:hypothetical protein
MAGAGEGAAGAPPRRSIWLLGSVALIAAAAILGGLAGAGVFGADKQGPSPTPATTESTKTLGDGGVPLAPGKASAGAPVGGGLVPPSPATTAALPGPGPVSTGVDASGNAAPAPGGLLAGLNQLLAGRNSQQGVAQVWMAAHTHTSHKDAQGHLGTGHSATLIVAAP